PLFSSMDPHACALYTLSLHDALPISNWTRIEIVADGGAADRNRGPRQVSRHSLILGVNPDGQAETRGYLHSPSQRLVIDAWKIVDRKSTRLNSSHGSISYAVFCLKKK